MLIFWLFASATCGAALIGLSLFLTVALATATLLTILEISSPLTKAVSWILGRKLLVSIGVLSYSIYLWHALLGIVFFEYFGREIQVKLIIIAFTLIVSYISYNWFEVPIQKILKRKFINK
jgi:peptidoglycan/LPS O-acetylase OafA/YrhL